MTEERPPDATPSPAPEAGEEPPPYTPPPIAPPASSPPPAAQPAVNWTPPPASAVAAGQRTMLSLGAGILLLILGILGVLLGLLVALVGGTFVRNFNFGVYPGFSGANTGEIVGGVVTFIGIVLIVGGIIYLVGGIGVIRSRDWGRIVGILVGILGGLFWLLGVIGGGQVGDTGGRAGGGAFALILLVVHAYVAIALLFFWRFRGSSAA